MRDFFRRPEVACRDWRMATPKALSKQSACSGFRVDGTGMPRPEDVFGYRGPYTRTYTTSWYMPSNL